MIIAWTLVLLLATQPYPAIALLMEFDTRAACATMIKKMEVSDDARAKLMCMPIAYEGI